MPAPLCALTSKTGDETCVLLARIVVGTDDTTFPFTLSSVVIGAILIGPNGELPIGTMFVEATPSISFVTTINSKLNSLTAWSVLKNMLFTYSAVGFILKLPFVLLYVNAKYGLTACTFTLFKLKTLPRVILNTPAVGPAALYTGKLVPKASTKNTGALNIFSAAVIVSSQSATKLPTPPAASLEFKIKVFKSLIIPVVVVSQNISKRLSTGSVSYTDKY